MSPTGVSVSADDADARGFPLSPTEEATLPPTRGDTSRDDRF
jgi:hypothetical protein